MEFDLHTADLSAMDLEDNFDFDYSVGERFIDSMEMFRQELLIPFQDKDRHMFYRGERVGGLNRPLLPTMYRNKNALLKKGEHCVEVNADFLLEYYKAHGSFYDLYNTTFGTAGKYRLYDLCAFSQHYLNDSPLIDFTKSLYVALSFGLKEKTEFMDDSIIYAVEIEDLSKCYTTDKVVAECWLNDFKVHVYNFDKDDPSPEVQALKKSVMRTSPTGRLIDIATNDLMKFQQGVFLLLSDFNLVNRLYLTKNVRSSFKITKYILSKDICADLVRMIAAETPWYRFSRLLDIKSGIQSAILCNETNL